MPRIDLAVPCAHSRLIRTTSGRDQRLVGALADVNGCLAYPLRREADDAIVLALRAER